MFLRFILAALGMAVVGGAIGFSVDDEWFDAAIGAAIGVGLVVWAGIRVLREELAKGSTAATTVVKWGAAAFVLVFAVIVGLLVVNARQDEAGFLLRDSQVELAPLVSLKGVRLGEKLPTDAQRNPRVHVVVAQDRVTQVSYDCEGSDATRINRVECHDRESRIVHVFGNAARRLCATAAGTYAFDVLDTGTRYVTADGRVTAFTLMEPQALETALGGDRGWRRC